MNLFAVSMAISLSLAEPYAEALYVGIITDTGNFEHGSYSSRTFRIVADLLEIRTGEGEDS